jgi:5-methylcytosine-specific restriction endonuclease McrA
MSDQKCYVCGAPATDVHHVFNASNRKKSTQYGFVVNLCRHCHDDLHFHSPQKYVYIKQEYQRIFEQTHTREQFIQEFGKSYL